MIVGRLLGYHGHPGLWSEGSRSRPYTVTPHSGQVWLTTLTFCPPAGSKVSSRNKARRENVFFIEKYLVGEEEIEGGQLERDSLGITDRAVRCILNRTVVLDMADGPVR